MKFATAIIVASGASAARCRGKAGEGAGDEIAGGRDREPAERAAVYAHAEGERDERG